MFRASNWPSTLISSGSGVVPLAVFTARFVNFTGSTPAGASLEHPELTPEDIEKKQLTWWFLLLMGVAALLGEAILSNRLSKRFGVGLLQVHRPQQVPENVRHVRHTGRV